MATLADWYLSDLRRATGIVTDSCDDVSHSSHVCSDKVRVVSKCNDDEQYTWELAAGRSFTVQKDAEMVYCEVKRGTKIIRYLREHQSESVEERRLKDLAKKHSEFIGFPNEWYVEKSKTMTLLSKTLRVIKRDFVKKCLEISAETTTSSSTSSPASA